MNGWLIFILIVILAGLILDFTISYLNLSALTSDLPDEFVGTYDQDEYRKSQEYTRTTTKFSLVSTSISTVITLIFLLSGGFNLIDNFARGFGYGEIITGNIFLGSLATLSWVLNLPFSLYSTFVIEERFGFNKTTPKLYITDTLKSFLLSIVLGFPIISLILWFFISAGSLAWVYCWLGVVLFSIIVQFLAPVLILPLFNKFSPLEEGSLKEDITEYAQKENFTIQGIFTMDGSKRSTKLNAFFTGFGKFRKIVFYDTLLEKLNESEIIAVLAHEMGHFKLRHIWKMLAASVAQTGIIFFLLSLILNNRSLFDAFSMTELSVYASLVFFGFIYSPVSLVTSIFFNIFSRKNEYEADRYAVESSGEHIHLINGLKKLSQANLSNLTPHPFAVFLEYSHPPVLQRIETIRNMNKAE